MTFEAMCQHLVQNHFISYRMHSRATPAVTCFNGTRTFGIHGPRLKDTISKKIGTKRDINHPKRSTSLLTTDDHRRLQRATPAHNELLAPLNDFMKRQFANRDTSRTNMLISALGHRMAQAAKLRGAHAQIVHTISRNFTIKDTNQIMECQGNLDQYIMDEMLMNNHCLEIVHSLNLTMLDKMLLVDD